MKFMGLLGFILAVVIALQSGIGVFGAFLRGMLGWVYVIVRVIMALDGNVLDNIMKLFG